MSNTIGSEIPVRSGTVRMHDGRPTIFVNDQPRYPLIYALTDVPGARWSWEDVPQYNVRQFASYAGVRLYQLDIDFEHMWQRGGALDIGLPRRQIQGVLEARPDAGVFLRLHVRPPKWWVQAHPEENAVVLGDTPKPEYAHGLHRAIEGDLRGAPRASLASRVWLAELGAMTRRFCRDLAATPEGNALIGLHVAGGVYGEWHYWGITTGHPDVGAAMTACFRAWLRERYGSDAALRAAWNDPAASLETAAVPGVEPRETSLDGLFRDPARERQVIDYQTCQHQAVADAIIHFARICKESWPRPLITGTYMGYFYSLFGKEATGGHLAYQRVVCSPHVDYLSGPVARYPDLFDAGCPYKSRGLIDSVRLHGKLWLDEMDQSVCLPGYIEKHYSEGIQGAIAKIRRNLMFTYSKGQGLWFYDFGPAGIYNWASRRRTDDLCANGWWDDPYLVRDIGRMHRLMTDRARVPFKSEADVLVVHDLHSFYHLNVKDMAITSALNNWTTVAFMKGGFVLDAVYTEDLPLADLSQYRTVVFVNTFKMTAEQRRFVRQRVAADGRHLIWFYAPGYTDGQRNAVEFVSEVTGITMRAQSLEGKAQITTDPRIRPDYQYSAGEEPVRPLFAVDDPAAESFGHYQGTDAVAIAKKDCGTHTNWYVALPSWDTTLGYDLLKLTPAHRYNDTGDIFYAGGGLLSLHTKQGGRRPVTLACGKKIEVEMPEGFGTVVLDSRTGQVLLPGVGKESLPPEGPKE